MSVLARLFGPRGWETSGGVPIVNVAEIAFDTPDLEDGAAIYVPSVGDILLDAWLELDEVWNGTTPTFDIGSFTEPNLNGWFGITGQRIDTLDISPYGRSGGSLIGDGNRHSLSDTELDANEHYFCNSRFVADDPIKAVVSQDGTPGGGDPGASQGRARVYVVAATPRPLGAV